MLTEVEAKQRWCPFARVGSSVTGLGAINREYKGGNLPGSNCVGSACMAWRVSSQEPEVFYTLRGVEVGPDAIVSWEDQDNLKRCERARPYKGFCGLAGAE